jgi:hypothetical protein
LYIHDVRGLKSSTISPFNASNDKNANATGSIVIEAGGFTTPTAFSNVPIQKILRSVDRQGIYTRTNWCRRPAMTSRWNTLFFQQWDTSMGFVVRNKQLYDIGGDGIVVKGKWVIWSSITSIFGSIRDCYSIQDTTLWTNIIKTSAYAPTFDGL